MRCWWVWVILAAFSWLIYYPVIDNFFVGDDFLWLHRARTLKADPFQVLKSEGLYFDPMIYISFWFNYYLSELDYRWYHFTDIMLHSLNGILVFYFTKQISKDDLLALLGSIVFVSSFAASDAVLWSSSRVDLLATLFSLVTVVLFFKFLEEKRIPYYLASILSYLLALSAKATPIILPAILLLLIVHEGKGKAAQKKYMLIIPFAVATATYLLLLWLSSDGNIVKGKHLPNLYNYFLSTSALFVPERILYKWNMNFVSALIMVFVLFLWFSRYSPLNRGIISLALPMMLLSLLPVLILGDFRLASLDADPVNLLGSPSHRIYLATVGMSILISSLLLGLYYLLKEKRRLTANILLTVIILFFGGVSCYENRQRERIWDVAAKRTEDILYGLKAIRTNFPEDSTIDFIGLPFPKGFLIPMLKVYYNMEKVKIGQPPDFFEYLLYPLEAFNPSQHFVFFVDSKKVYDFSDPVSEIFAYRLKAQQPGLDNSEREIFRQKYWDMAADIEEELAKDRYLRPGPQ